MIVAIKTCGITWKVDGRIPLESLHLCLEVRVWLDPCTKADMLNCQFSSVFTKEDFNHLPQKNPSPYPVMSPIVIHNAGVYKLLSRLNQRKASSNITMSCVHTPRTVFSALVPVWVHLCTASALNVLPLLFTVTTVWRDILGGHC